MIKSAGDVPCFSRAEGHCAFPWRPAAAETKVMIQSSGRPEPSTLVCNWQGRHFHDVPYAPDYLQTSVFHTVDLLDPSVESRVQAWWHRLKLTEHWAALPIIFQVPLYELFRNGETPYSTNALVQVAEWLLEERAKVNNILRFSPTQEWRFKEDGQVIVIKPTTEPRLRVTGEFDFTEHSSLHWIGKQQATFDSQAEAEKLLEFVAARAPILPWYKLNVWIAKVLGKRTVQSCIIDKPKKMEENEVARHKIMDFLALLNFLRQAHIVEGHHFLAAEIFIERLSHRIGVLGMQQFVREIWSQEDKVRIVS